MFLSGLQNMRTQNLTILNSLLAITLLFNIIFAQENLSKIAVVGQSISGVEPPTYKSNQSQVIWHDDNWWGVFADDQDGEWYLYKFNGSSWSQVVHLGYYAGESLDMYMDETNGKLYVLFYAGDRVSRLTYNSGSESFSLDNGFPIQVDLEPNSGNTADDPACITQALDGDLFIFWGAADGNLMGLHSSDDGETWTNAFQIASTGVTSSLADAISFQDGGNDYIGVFVGAAHDEFSFFKLDDSDDPTNSNNWDEENLPINPEADDHVNIVKDASNNLYAIGKTGDSIPFYLFKRHITTGSWSSYAIDPSDPTRPALAIDETYDKLLIFATLPRTGSPQKIQYTVLDKDNLTDVSGDDSWIPVLEDGSNNITDVTVSYQILNNSTNIMVCATNDSRGEVWYNLLISDDALPVSMAFFNANTDIDKINLEWATYSEVSNWEWIVQRREGEVGDFSEITRLPGAGNTNTITYYQYSDINIDQEKTYYYRLASVDFNGTVHNYPQVVKSTTASSIASFALYSNYPNPFNSETTIRFEIGEISNTILDIVDISGRKVRRLFEGELNPGSYNHIWNGKDEYDNDVASGVYIVTLSAGNYFQAKRIVLSR